MVADWIFLSGQGGFDPATGRMISDDVAEQTEQTFRKWAIQFRVLRCVCCEFTRYELRGRLMMGNRRAAWK